MTDEKEPSPQLVREWAVCAIVASVARFVPVPLLDDVVKERATRVAIDRTLKAHGRTYGARDVEVLYGGADGWLAQTRRYVVGVPSRVLLFPVRKYTAVLGAVKGVPTDVLEVLLLARTVDRVLAREGLAGGDAKQLRREARQVRVAFETALDGMDVSLLTTTLSQGLSRGKGLAAAAVDRAREMFARDDEVADVDATGDLGDGADDVEAVLARPDVRAKITEFDALFDAELAEPSRRHR